MYINVFFEKDSDYIYVITVEIRCVILLNRCFIVVCGGVAGTALGSDFCIELFHKFAVLKLYFMGVVNAQSVS